MSEGRVGSQFGPYELRALLGRGGMGEVFEAHDRVKDRVVALKLLPQAMADDADFRERFRREARTVARLQDPHVIPIHDFGEIDGTLYIDMRLVRGSTLKDLINQGPLGVDRSVGLVSQVASALDSAHADGLIHRDIKPENVLIAPGDFAYLADFGIAASEHDTRLTGTGSAVGSVAYMAPERFRDGALSGAADIYSLGCVLYECLTGTTPFRAGTVSAQIAGILHDSPSPASRHNPQVPAGIDAALAQVLAKEPHERFRSAGAFANAVRHAVGTGAQTAPTTLVAATSAPQAMAEQVTQTSTPASPSPASATTASAKSTSRATWWAAAAAVLIAALVVGGLVLKQLGGEGEQAAGPGSTLSEVAGGATATPARTEQPTSDSAEPASSTSQETPRSSEASTSSTSAAPSSSTQPSNSSASAPATTSAPGLSGPGYGPQGWSADAAARCNVDDPAVTLGRSRKTYVAICRSNASGGYYYRAFRPSGGPTEIQHPRRTSTGWLVQNKGHTYVVSPSRLVVTDPSGKKILDEAWAQYDSR